MRGPPGYDFRPPWSKGGELDRSCGYLFRVIALLVTVALAAVDPSRASVAAAGTFTTARARLGFTP